jgi:hypothetical protein
MYRDSAVGRYHKIAQRHNHDALGMFMVVCVRVREHTHIQYKQDKRSAASPWHTRAVSTKQIFAVQIEEEQWMRRNMRGK